MAVPKRKMSRANTRTRRSTWKADLTELNTVKVAGREIRVPRRLARHTRTASWTSRADLASTHGPGTSRPGPLSCPQFDATRP